MKVQLKPNTARLRSLFGSNGKATAQLFMRMEELPTVPRSLGAQDVYPHLVQPPGQAGLAARAPSVPHSHHLADHAHPSA